MTKQNGSSRNPWRAAAALCVVLLAASSLHAISAREDPNRRRLALRESLIRGMDVFAANYDQTDWSPVLEALAANPSDPENPAFLSVPLSLANVYLNRYETRADPADLERAVGIAEWVAANRALWEGREGSGSVVSYLDITARRLRSECDAGGLDVRIEELWRAAMAITAEEADRITRPGERCRLPLRLDACLLQIQPYPSEEEARASRAALLAAAASFLSEDGRSGQWARAARDLAAALPASECRAPASEIALSQATLTFRLAGVDAPVEFDSGGPSENGSPALSCAAASPGGYETGSTVAIVEAGPSLAAAIHDSRVVSFALSEIYLWIFPPGSRCGSFGDTGDIVPEQRSR